MAKKILFICGSLNQTTIMHKIYMQLSDYDCYFTSYYADGFLKRLSEAGFLDFTILGSKLKNDTLNYLLANNLNIDFRGSLFNYELVFTCSDLVIPKNIIGKKTILVQEGMTDPENFLFHLVKKLKLPRYLASTATTGLSNNYDYFCVASDGYKNLFIKKGVRREKIAVTGLPNFDNCIVYNKNDFPYKNFVLVATSDARETFKYENRKRFIKDAVNIAADRLLIFKLHPNENIERATKEIKLLAPHALVYSDGNVNEMIANCDVLITKYSSVVYVGLALGKEVYSYFNLDELKKLQPIQNNGKSAKNIADLARFLIDNENYIQGKSKNMQVIPLKARDLYNNKGQLK